MTFAQRRKPQIDAGTEYGDGPDSESAGNVHRTAVVAHQQLAPVDERHELAQSDFGWNHSFYFAQRRTVILRIDEHDNAMAFSPRERLHHLPKALQRPPFLRDTRPWMHSYECHVPADSIVAEIVLSPTALRGRHDEFRCFHFSDAAKAPQQPKPVRRLVTIGIVDRNRIRQYSIAPAECVGNAAIAA